MRYNLFRSGQVYGSSMSLVVRPGDYITILI